MSASSTSDTVAIVGHGHESPGGLSRTLRVVVVDAFEPHLIQSPSSRASLGSDLELAGAAKSPGRLGKTSFPNIAEKRARTSIGQMRGHGARHYPKDTALDGEKGSGGDGSSSTSCGLSRAQQAPVDGRGSTAGTGQLSRAGQHKPEQVLEAPSRHTP